nr:hypothetical protein [uncultured Cellulosilyticum sp.]
MGRNKTLIYTLIAAMTMTAMPAQIFAQGVTTSSQVVAEKVSTATTGSALGIETTCLFPTNQNLIKTNIVKVSDGEMENGFSLSYEWDDNWFFNDNTVFNRGLCKTASLFSALSYYSSDIDFAVNEAEASTYGYALATDASDINTAQGIMGVMASHGFEDAAEYNLRNYYDDGHVTQFNVGHKKISNGSEEKEVIMIAIRGTRAQMEWLSNFAMGQDKEFGNVADWTEKQNHMGLDITANRIIKLVEEYMTENGVDTQDATFMITGHSRGGALANLVGKKLEDKNFTTYTYSFATPNTTLDENAANTYPSIFNIVNEEDLVPEIPTEAWGFTKYGRTINTDMNLILKTKWATITGKTYMSSSMMNDAVDAIGDIIEDRDAAFDYSNVDKIKVTKSFSSEEKRADALASIPEACLPYAQIELTEGKNLIGKKTYGYTMLQSPMYFITAAGLNLAGTMSAAEFLTFDVAEAYKTAKTKLILAGIGGLSHPHYMESYILLAYSTQLKNVKALDIPSEAALHIDVE